MDEIYQPKLWKRLLADVIDFLLFALVLLAFDLPQYLGAWDLFGLSETHDEELADRRDSGLFEFSEDGTTFSYLTFDMEATDREAEFQKILDAISYYYLDYKPTLGEDDLTDEERDQLTPSYVNTRVLKIDPETLCSDVLTISAIDADPASATLLPTLTRGEGEDQEVLTSADQEYWEIAVAAMNDKDSQGCYDIAISDYANLPHMTRMREHRSLIHSYQIMWSAAVSTVIFFLIIPCALPYCQTLGRRFEKIAAVSKDGYMPSLLNRLSRNIVQTLFVWLSVSLLVFIPLFIDLILLLCNKNHRSLADFVAGTVLIDLNRTTMIDPKDAKSAQEDLYEHFTD